MVLPLLEEVEALEAIDEAVLPPLQTPRLRHILVALDVAGLGLAWLLATLVPLGTPVTPLWEIGMASVVLTLFGLFMLAIQKLYLARVCSVRTVEVARLGRVALSVGALAAISHGWVDIQQLRPRIVLGTFLTFCFLFLARGLYRSWLYDHRTTGRFSRRMVLVGTNEEAHEIATLLGDHPELGYRVCGVVGDFSGVEQGAWKAPWLGTINAALDAVRATRANGVIIAASSLPSSELNRVTRLLLQEGIHVHLSSGLAGIDWRRLRALPLAHEPLFYLEPVTPSAAQMALKRVLDVALATIALFLTLPVLVLAAIAIKLQDRGPVLFRHQRTGRDGKAFTIYKLRTMVIDAESRLDQVRHQNQREGGPLFKLANDPRVTRVGRLLRATSIDELPQLFNVMNGTMSLVGPRPALAHEVAAFDEQLMARLQVRPGITGLWQVEARDNPSFHPYRRLDLFYLENWSISLDLAILLATVESVLGRGIRGLTRRDPPSAARARRR